MTSKSKKILAGLAVIAIGVIGVTRVLRAQKESDPGPREEMKTIIEGTNQPWLGVALKDLTPEQARELKLGDENGAVVEKVEADSPAAKAGIQTGDVIVEFAGERVRSVAELRRLVRETPLGRTVEVHIRRNGDKKTLSATLEARKESLGPLVSRLRNQTWPAVNMPVYDFSFNFNGPHLGISADELTPQLAEYFGVKQGKGVLVREVASGSAAEKAGLRAGDCIVQVDSAPVESVADLHRALTRQPGESHEVALTIVRDHQQQTVKAQIEARQPSGHHPMADSGIMMPGMPDMDDLENLEDEVRAIAPEAGAQAGQARELAREFASKRVEIQKQAAEAVRQARDLQKQFLEHKGEWQQELRQLGPQMQQLQRDLQKLQNDATTV